MTSYSLHPSYITRHPYISSALTLLLSSAIMPLFYRNHMPVENRTILVTGASQGMGKALAILLSSKGAHVCIVARNQEKLDLALSEIKVSAPPSLRPPLSPHR
jgi:3-dehydrosphinganine reductase